jgi:hypothetical protein
VVDRSGRIIDGMSEEPRQDLDDDEFDDGEEEIPRSVMFVVLALAIVMAVLYLTVGGGHNHFH